jgi:hypothetical protein
VRALTGAALLFACLLLASRARSAAPPPTVSILNPRSGTPATPAPVSPALFTNAFKVQVQVWNDVADVGTVEVGWCTASSDPESPASWRWSAPAPRNAAYDCGERCGIYDLVLTQLAAGDYRLVARATSAADGPGHSSDGRQGDARWVHVRVLPQGSGTGMLLVRESSSRLCMDCHQVRSHSSQGGDGRYGNWQLVCLDCHTPHATPNLALVKPRILAPDGVEREVKLHALAGDGPAALVDSAAGAATSAVCQVCHTNTKGAGDAPRWRNDGNADAGHYQAGGANGAARCSPCHSHVGGFSHQGPGVRCDSCHGHDPGWPGSPTPGAGTHVSHSTHTENDADDLRGPNLGCEGCHDLAHMPGFATGTDANGDGRISLAETDVCDGCHSRAGPVDGVDDPIIGAKASWAAGVYSGGTLAAGKERWCVGCHDAGRSVIPLLGGRQAPDVAGDGVTWGFYVSGHGGMGRECAACHDEGARHNFDGRRTYAATLDNYGTAFRLSPVDLGLPTGPVPAMKVPRAHDICDPWDRADFALCLSCHDERRLIGDVRSAGFFDCKANPYLNAATLETGYRNLTAADGDGVGPTEATAYPQNLHADHLISLTLGAQGWRSEGPGTASNGDSTYTCSTCHDPHGPRRDGGGPTDNMTVAILGVSHGTDATGSYGALGSSAWLSDPARATCAWACHGGGERWYLAIRPTVTSIALADADPSDPLPAEGGYTNQRSVAVTLAAGGSPTEMSFAQDAAFLENATPWQPWSPSTTYTLTAGDGVRAVFVRLRNAVGDSASASGTVVLDTQPPTFPGGGLTAPNGGEVWDFGSTHAVAWTAAADAHLAASPIGLELSLDGGATFPTAVASAEADDGAYSWTLPDVESTAARVRVSAVDRAGNRVTDASDATFTIRRAVPVVERFVVVDANPADPSPAEAAFTNSRDVRVEVNASAFPSEMELAQDSAFTVNSTGWIPFAAVSSYTLTAGDGRKLVYLRLRNGSGTSATSSVVIALDATPPAIASNTLTAPVGGEVWTRKLTRAITWVAGQVTDANVAAAPISLHYSTDSGVSWPTLVAATEANDGSYDWTLPAELSWRSRIRLTATDRAGNRTSQASGADFAVAPLYLVTNTADSGGGSLRSVLGALVVNGGNDTIWFNVPPSSLTDGVAVVNLSAFLDVGAPGITIDATSQAGLRGDTNPRGPEVRLNGWTTASGLYNVGFWVAGANATIRGFQLTGFNRGVHTSAANTRVVGNHICFRSGATTPWTRAASALAVTAGSTSSGMTFGGSAAEDRNHVAGCSGDAGYGSMGAALLGGYAILENDLFGLLPDGTDLAGGTLAHVYDTGSGSVLRRNQFTGSTRGVTLGGSFGSASGNVFGLYWDGAGFQPRTPQSIALEITGSGGGKTIGGAPATSDSDLRDSNVFNVATAGTCILVSQDSDYYWGSQVGGNFIGTNPSRTARYGGAIGVEVAGAAAKTQIGAAGYNDVGGGPVYGLEANVIENMTTAGVRVGDGATWIGLAGNTFGRNGASLAASDDAIQLVGGANGGLTRPVISDATATAVVVQGVGFGEYVEVYLSDYDGSGTEFGEGRRVVGRTWAWGSTVTVDVTGSGLLPGQHVTALRSQAMQVVENEDEPWFLATSPFSANVLVH